MFDGGYYECVQWILPFFLIYLSCRICKMFCESSSKTDRWSKYKEFFLIQDIDLKFEDYKHGLLTGPSANDATLKSGLKGSSSYEIYVKYSCPSSLVFYEFLGLCFVINIILGILHLSHSETESCNVKADEDNNYSFWGWLGGGWCISFLFYSGFYISYIVRYNLQKEKQKISWQNFKAYFSKTCDCIAKEYDKNGILHACNSCLRFSWFFGAFFFNLIVSITLWNCVNLKDKARWFSLLRALPWLLPTLYFCLHQISYRLCNYMELLKWVNAKLNSNLVYLLVFLLIVFSLRDNWTHFLEKSCSRNCSHSIDNTKLSAQEIIFCKHLEDIREQEKGFLYKFFFKYAIQCLKEGFNRFFTSSGNGKNVSDNFCEMQGDDKYVLSNKTEIVGDFFVWAYSTNQLAVLLEGICLVILNTFIDLSKIFEDYGWMVSVVIQWLRVEISSHFMKYEHNMIISWNIFDYREGNNVKTLKIINEGSVSLNDMLNHDPKLLEVVIAAANKTTEDFPFLVLDLDNQINFSRNLITKVSERLSSSNWPIYAMNNVENRNRINEDVLIIVTCEKDTQFKHTRAWLIFPSELEMLKNSTYAEINNASDDSKFKVAKPNHRVRISNLKKWADSYFNKDDKDHKDIKLLTQPINLPCQNNYSSHTYPNSINNTPRNSETKSNQSSPRNNTITSASGAHAGSSRRNSAAQGASLGSTAKNLKVRWSDSSESTASPRSLSSPSRCSSNATSTNASDSPNSSNITLKRTKSPLNKQTSKQDEKSSTSDEQDPDFRFFEDDQENIKKSPNGNSSPLQLEINRVGKIASKRTRSPSKRSL